jgi:hypothetical protein
MERRFMNSSDCMGTAAGAGNSAYVKTCTRPAGLVVMLACSLAFSAVVATPAKAESSNRNQVRQSLSGGGWTVVWGKNFTEGDWVLGSAAIAESVAAKNPQPFLAWFDAVLQENFAKIQGNLVTVNLGDLEALVMRSLSQKGTVAVAGLDLDAGFATYNRWERIVVEVPDGIEFQGIKSKVKMKRIEKKIPLPNWHQFYVRYRLKDGGGQPPVIVKPSLPPQGTEPRAFATLENPTSHTLHFILNGQSRSLAAGEQCTIDLGIPTDDYDYRAKVVFDNGTGETRSKLLHPGRHWFAAEDGIWKIMSDR